MLSARFRATKKAGKVRIELTVKEYEGLLDDLDELDAIRSYDETKKSRETTIPFERTVRKAARFSRMRK